MGHDQQEALAARTALLGDAAAVGADALSVAPARVVTFGAAARAPAAAPEYDSPAAVSVRLSAVPAHAPVMILAAVIAVAYVLPEDAQLVAAVTHGIRLHRFPAPRPTAVFVAALVAEAGVAVVARAAAVAAGATAVAAGATAVAAGATTVAAGALALAAAAVLVGCYDAAGLGAAPHHRYRRQYLQRRALSPPSTRRRETWAVTALAQAEALAAETAAATAASVAAECGHARPCPHCPRLYHWRMAARPLRRP